MTSHFRTFHWLLYLTTTVFFVFSLTACGSGGGGDGSSSGTNTVSGVLSVDSAIAPATVAIAALSPGTTMTLDDGVPVPIDGQGHFTATGIPDGDHSLFVHLSADNLVELPFRMVSGRSLDFGMVTITDGQFHDMTGFNGYHFGWVDADGDGRNDNFADSDGDGICDPGFRFAGAPYLMNMGFVDVDGDGINDHFTYADGDGINDLTGHHSRHGFGFIDENNDGINDNFLDADGDGICDLTGIPFGHPFGWADADHDGINDHFTDSDGNGLNDITGEPYIAMPGWVDLDGDGINDFFRDADGDGIGDLSESMLSYGHGFGWVDENNDGINDRFVDADGDGVNDYGSGPYASHGYRYGYRGVHPDLNGDGIDDLSGHPYRQCFGWVDSDGDGVNDAFTDADANGINDVTGRHYDGGFHMEHGEESHPMSGDDFPWPHGQMGGGGMMQ